MNSYPSAKKLPVGRCSLASLRAQARHFALPALIFIGAMLVAPLAAVAQTPTLNFAFNDNVPSLSTTDSVTLAVVNMTNVNAVAADMHGTNGSGPGKLGRSLDITTDNGAVTGNTVTTKVNASDWADPKINLGTVSTYTVSFWFKNNATFGSGNSPLLFELGPGAGARSLFATQGANTLGFAENTSGNPEFWAGSTLCTHPVASGSLIAGTWYFYALTYDGSNYRVYAGNETNAVTLVNTIAGAGQSLAFGTTGSIIFGNRGSDLARSFPGWLAHFQFYSGYVGSQNFVDGIRQANLPLTVKPTVFSPLSPVFVGTPVAITSGATNGIPPYTYDWQKSIDGGITYGTDLGAGNNDGTYSLNTTGQGNTTNFYRLVVTDSETPAVIVTNTPASLYVSSTPLPPTVVSNTTISPSVILLGGTATLSATISGTAPISYQWQFSVTNNGTGLINVPGATNATYVLTNAQYSNTGYYWLTATNASGGTNTAFASLSVLTPVVISVGPAAGPNPPVGSYDIAQLNTSGDVNAPGGNALNYFDNNGTKPGQTFTTGSNPTGYSLGSLYYKCGGPVINNGNHGAAVTYTLRIYSLTNATAGSAVLLTTYTNQNVAPAIPNNVWAQWTGLTNVFLPNTSYAYSISASSGFMHMGNASNVPAFYNGGLGLFPTAGGAVTFATPAATSDATFLVNMVPAGFVDPVSVSISPASSPTSPIYGGVPVTLSVSSIGTGPLSYDWQTDNGTGGATWTDLPASNSSVYNLNTASFAAGTYQFHVIVTNSLSSATSSIVQLYLLAASAPVVTTNTTITPSGVFVGASATMTAAFSGTPTISYQWMFNNGSGAVPITSATNSTFTLNNAQLTNTGSYFLVASNGIAPFVASSTPVQFLVAPAPQNNGGSCVVVDFGGSAPAPGTNDVGQVLISSPGVYGPTTIPGLNYYVDAGAPEGQTFTTSNNPPTAAGYPLTSVYVQEELSTVGNAANTTPQTYTLSIYKVTGSNAVLLTSYTTVNSLTFNEGDWIQFTGLTNMLQANSTYAYSVHRNGTGYWKLASDENPFDPNDPINDLYLGGQIAGLPANGVGNMTFSTDPTIDAAFLIGITPVGAPVIAKDTQIVPSIVSAGGAVALSAYFNGASPLKFQWLFTDTNGVGPAPVAGATNSTYAIPAAHLAQAGTYSLLAWNSFGTNSSTPATLSVVSMILTADTTITPSSAYTNANIPVTISAAFDGVGLKYQWLFDNGSGPALIPGATNATYSIANFAAANIGSYFLVASNSPDGNQSVLASTPAQLTALPVPTDLLINFSYNQQYNNTGVFLSPDGGIYWNQLRNSGSGSTNVTSLAPDGGTGLGIGLTVISPGSFTSAATGIGLLQYYELLQTTGVTDPITFNNVPQGVYNVIFYSADGAFNNSHTTFAIGTQTNTANANNSSTFIQNNNYVVFTNVLTTNGTIAATWSYPGNHEAAFNGAQLQLAYALAHPRIFVYGQPSDVTVPTGSATSLTVGAEGPGLDGLPGPLFYQWWTTNGVTGSPINGATNSSYLVNTAAAGTTSYFAIVTNLTGLSTNSAVATVNVFVPDTLVWRGLAGSAWDLSTPNWSNVSQQVDGVAYADPDTVRFDDTAASFLVSNSLVVLPSSVVATNNSNNYFIVGTGSMSGAMSLTMNGTATLTISNNNSYTGGTVVNNGTLVLAKGGAAGSVSGTLTVNPHGTVSLAAGDALGFSGNYVTTVNLLGGVMNNATTGNEAFATVFNLAGGTLSSSGGGAYNFSGAQGAVNSLATNIASTVTANIAMRANGLAITTAQGTVPGGIDLRINGAITDAGGNTLTKSGNGTLSLAGTNTFNGDITINAGALRIDGAGRLNSGNYTAQIHNNGTLFSYNSSSAQTIGNTISGTGALTENGPGTLTLNGVNTYSGPTTVNGGTLAGIGAITSAVTVNSGGTLAPGSAGTGILTLSNNLVLNAGSTNTFTVDGSTPAYPTVAVGGTVIYGGVLNVVPSGTFTAGQSFALFSGAGASGPGNFASIQGSPGLGLGFQFTNGVLSVISTGSAGPVRLTNSVSGNVLSLRWPAGQGWRLQAQTNSLNAGLKTTGWVYVTSSAVSSISITNDPAQATVFYRLSNP